LACAAALRLAFQLASQCFGVDLIDQVVGIINGLLEIIKPLLHCLVSDFSSASMSSRPADDKVVFSSFTSFTMDSFPLKKFTTSESNLAANASRRAERSAPPTNSAAMTFKHLSIAKQIRNREIM
ncbi:LOW QUALITY PROTEIN: hypothetical protein TorRG33x02_194100, partial [Trema orientale]